MEYSVHELAKISGVSVRTLHYYEEVGLLCPKRNNKNQYRTYSENDLLILQQILFYKVLDFSLEEIKKIMNSKDFEIVSALRSHKKMILDKKKRIDGLVKTIDDTILKITKNKKMKDEDLFDSLIEKQLEKHEKEYAKEAKAKWGSTEAYKQSTQIVAKMSKDDMKKIMKEQIDISNEMASCLREGVGLTSSKVQCLVERHYNWLKNFYEPNAQMYVGLANIYVDDPRFAKNYNDIGPGLAKYFSEAMKVFVKEK